jgi:hypothetical protein
MRSTHRRSRRKTRAIVGVVVASLVAALLNAATAAPAQAATVGCQVAYVKQSEWPGGFTAQLTLQNVGTAAWNGWTLTFHFPDANQHVGNAWSANWSQAGTAVTATNLSWNGSVAAGGNTGIGFNGTWTTADPIPTDFAINGVACAGPDTPPTVTITSPTNGQHFTAPATIPLTASASDPDVGDSISKVEFYHDGLLLATVTSAPYTYTWSAVPAGSYSVQAQAYDTKGGSTLSPPVPIVVDPNTAPAVLVTATQVSVPQGTSATVGVRLSTAPAANLTVSVTGATTGDQLLTASPATLTFTPSNFGTAQMISIADSANDGTTGSRIFTLAATGYTSVSVTANAQPTSQSTYTARFLAQYNKLHAPTSGYFSPEGIPYHSVETLMVEAPDYGHETTSEAFSFWLWLEATYGQVTGSWDSFNAAWVTMEKYIIPATADQPTTAAYNPSAPAQYAPEAAQPSLYPTALQPNAPVGVDPIANELTAAYGTTTIYGMHWLLDVDDIYGYGHCEDHTTRPSYINTYQRGEQESVWETIPQPSCDTLRPYGGTNGYLDLFQTGSSYASQWKYTDAPDADARAIEAAYWAYTWASAQGKASAVAATVAKAGKMGDYLRYAMFDKYFKQIGNCVGESTCANGAGKSSMDYLLGWYYAWGGSTSTSGSWAWRIGDGAAHFGYQNPMAAWALTNVPAMAPKGATAATDWTASLSRQLQFYQWLQSSEGAFAGGATNSWAGNYGTPPAGDSTFYGMFYTPNPVYDDPPSNNWFGMQAWSGERLAEYYYATGDATAKSMLDKWVTWAEANTTINADGSFLIPDTLNWSGQPATWNASNPAANTNLHVTVTVRGQDLGVAAAYAKLLEYYAAKSGNAAAKTLAKQLLDGIWRNTDSIGVSVPETRTDYNRFTQVWNSSTQQGLFVPAGWTGTMPNGDVIKSGDTFLDIRSWYTSDPQWSKVQTYLNGGAAPVFNYHRFWAQSDVAMANADYGMLFPNG